MATDRYSTLNFVGGAGITGLPQAAQGDAPVTLDQMNAVLEGLAWKDDVVAAAPGNVNIAAPGATIDGVAMVNGYRFLLPNQTTASQNGIYIWNGAAAAATRAPDMSVSAEFNGAVVPVKPGGTANGGTSWRCTTADPTVGTTSIGFTSLVTAAPSASETTSGIAEIATQTETDTGTDDARIVTPLKLANWSGRKLKAVATIGDASATSFNLDHNFGTRDVQVGIYKNSGSFDEVQCDITRPSTNRVTLTFASAPALNALRVVVLG